MALFKKFFRPKVRIEKWQDANPEVRQQALQDLKSPDQLITFVNNESLAELRQLAIARIDQHSALEQLLHSTHDDVRQAARSRLLTHLLPANNDLSQIQDSRLLVQIAGLTDDNALRLQAIAHISDEQERLQLARTHAVAKVRLAAAEGIDSPELLQQLLDHAQGKDKAIYRLCKDRLAAHKAVQQERQAQTDAIDNLLAQAKYLNKVGYHPEFNGKLQLLNKQWQELQTQADAATAASINAELAQANTLLSAHAEEEQRQAATRAAASEAASQQEQLLQRLSQLAEAAAAEPQTDISAALQQLQQDWDQAFHQHKPAAEQARQFENQLQQLLALQSANQHYSAQQEKLQKWLNAPLADDMNGLKNTGKQAQQWLKQLAWPQALPAPAWLKAIINKQQQTEAVLAQLQQQQQARLNTLDQQLAALEQALNDGQLKDASRLSQQILQNLRQVDNQAAHSAQRQYRSLSARLQEMRDWQGFATTPKKEALVNTMEALINADIDAGILADKIHALQEEWKTLGHAPADQALWERFQAAGDQAFEPCRAYFAAIAEQRSHNVELRQQLTTELLSYEAAMDWSGADWKTVQKTLDTARETFRQYSPVERNAHKATQEAFQQACDAIYGHLKAEYDRNLQAKQALVDNAAALVEQDNLSGAIDQVKQLQQQWKVVGVTPRHPDQKLWKQFRSHCDAVFARLDENKAERKAQLEQVVSSAEALVQQAAELLNGASEAPLPQRRKALAEIKQQFSALELPRSAHQRLSKQLLDHEQQLQDLHLQQQKQAEQARWTGLISRLQNLGADDAQWAEASSAALPQGYDETLFSQARENSAISDENAQDLCILMEILADSDSADADKSRRMALQVQRLAEGLGKGLTPDQERQQLIERWLNANGNRDAALLQRFVQALQASL